MELAFVHVPKTGGRTIRGTNNLLIVPALQCHLTFAERYRRGETEGKFSFAFVRNPWERLHSWWRHAMHWRSMTFEQYVLGHARTEHYVHMTRLFTEHLIAQQEVWVEADEAKMDFIGRFENLQGDFNTVCRVAGAPALTLGHENISPVAKEYPYGAITWTDEMLATMAPVFEPFADKYGYQPPEKKT